MSREHAYSDDDLVFIGDAADLVSVSIPTLRRWADSGLIPVYRTPAGQRRYRVGDLRAVVTPDEPDDDAGESLPPRSGRGAA